MREESESDVI